MLQSKPHLTFNPTPWASPSAYPHQAVCVDPPPGLRAGLGKRGEKGLPIVVIVENHLSPIPSIHHVINRPRIHNPQPACRPASPSR